MSSLLKALGTQVGKKVAVAVTGLGLFAFLVVHLAGNLLVFAGPASFNAYGDTYVRHQWFTYAAEAGLILFFGVHVVRAVQVTLEGRRARPVAYARKQWAGATSRKSLASSTMIYTGAITALFVLLHLKTFKFGPSYPGDAGVRDLHRLVVEVFSNPLWVLFYVLCMVLLGFHLYHGFSSAFQSLGVDHPRLTPKLSLLGKLLAVAVGGGFALIPLVLYFTRVTP